MGYYETCAFPKPGSQKKKKKCNGYKDKPNRICRYCGKTYAERHEVFGGPNRQISIDEGFQIDVCHEHHKELQDNITDWAKIENLRVRQEAQRKYMEKWTNLGITERDALKLWMARLGRNYLDVIPD